jgi:hypothetical protein
MGERENTRRRRAERGAVAKVRGGGFGTTLGLAVLLVVLALVAGVGIARYGDRVPWLAPILGQPTQNSEAVVLGVQKLNQLATAKQTIQVIVTEEQNTRIFQQPLPEFLTGEKVLLVAVGDVEAGRNLDELGKDDVHVQEKEVTINLPDAEILDSSLNEDKTELYDRDRGLLKIQGNDALLEEARWDAEDRMVDVAKGNGIVEQAQQNAEQSIRAFVTSMGYQEVEFT